MLRKVILSGRPVALSSRFHFNHEVTSRETRQSGHLALDKPRTNHVKRSFIYRSSQLFNNACVNMGDGDLGSVAAKSFKTFAKRIVRNL